MNIFRRILNLNNVIFILAIAFCIMFGWSNFIQWRERKIDEAYYSVYIEITTSVYKISNQCIKDYYSDKLTEDGKVFSVNEIEDGCQAIYIGEFKTIVRGNDSGQKTRQQAVGLYNYLVEHGGNAAFMKKAVIRSTWTDEIVEDWTYHIRNNQGLSLDNDKYKYIFD